MGNIQNDTCEMSAKWQSSDMLFKSIYLKVEVTVPTSDPLVFPHWQRRRYKCNFLTEVLPAGTRSVYLIGCDCTAFQLVNEYMNIVNKTNGHANDDDGE